MESTTKQFLTQLKEERPTYLDMVEWCTGGRYVLNNYIVEELTKKDLYFEHYCGDDRIFYNAEDEEITEREYYEQEDNGAYYDYNEIYQYYIISGRAADNFAEYTDQMVIYNEDLDLYLLCVMHWGTAWWGVPASWKDPEEVED